MKKFISSEAEAYIGAIFVASKELVPMLQTLIEMGWYHPHTPIKIDNSMAVGVVNETIILQKTKSMNLRLHWLRCCESQQQFLF